MRACIILHNIIVENERDTYAGNFTQLPFFDDVENDISQLELGEETFVSYERYLQNNIQLHDRQKHRQLQADLMEYIWQFYNTR